MHEKVTYPIDFNLSKKVNKFSENLKETLFYDVIGNCKLFIFFLKCNIPPGKIVPKQFYKYENIGEASETESNWLDTDLYHLASVMKGSPHDVSIL